MMWPGQEDRARRDQDRVVLGLCYVTKDTTLVYTVSRKERGCTSDGKFDRSGMEEIDVVSVLSNNPTLFLIISIPFAKMLLPRCTAPSSRDEKDMAALSGVRENERMIAVPTFLSVDERTIIGENH